MHEKWMKVIRHVWSTICYWELAKQYLKDQPSGSFFLLAWHAVKDKVLMSIAHAVTLCEEAAKQIAIGPEAAKSLAELKDLYRKGDLKDRSALVFDDSGVMVFRDKVLAHPLNKIKEIHGKDQYKVSVKWETVDATIGKIREFCERVENHNHKDWQTASYLGGTEEGSDALREVLAHMEQSKKDDRLKREITQRGKSLVDFDWTHREFVIENDSPQGQ